MLNSLDVSHNKLYSLPETLWFAPRLRELNVSNNVLSVLPAVGSLQFRSSSSLSEIEKPESLYSDLCTHQSTLSTDDSLSINGRSDDSNITIHELKRSFKNRFFFAFYCRKTASRENRIIFNEQYDVLLYRVSG